MGVKETAIGYGNTGYAPSRAEGAGPSFSSLQEQMVQSNRAHETPTCYVYLTGTVNIASATVTLVSWSAAHRNFTDVNNVAMWTAGAPGQIFIPQEYVSGWWDIQVNWRWNFTTVGGRRVVIVHAGTYGNSGLMLWDELSAGTQPPATTSANVGVTHVVRGRVLLSAGDDVRLSVYQDTQATLSAGRANGSTKHYWEGSMIVRWDGVDG